MYVESVRMLVGVVRSDTAQSHAMVSGWLKSLWRHESESKPYTMLTFVIGLVVTPTGTIPLGVAEACCRWMGLLDDLTACIVYWMEANRPSFQVRLFFLFSDSSLRSVDISRSRSVLYGVLAEVRLFQSFPLCSSNLDVRRYR